MRRSFFRLIGFTGYLWLFANSLFAQKTNPPGTIWLKDNLYIDATPVLNIHYREYYFSLKRYHYNLDSLDRFTATLPLYGANVKAVMDIHDFPDNKDSAQLFIDKASQSPLRESLSYAKYLWDPVYNYYPLVNVDYRIATNYCRWRTAGVAMWQSFKTKDKRAEFYDSMKYRVATAAELAMAAEKFRSAKQIRTLTAGKHRFAADIFLADADRQFFYITGLSEIVLEIPGKPGPAAMKWNIAGKRTATIESIEKNSFANDMTFRCICEVK